MSSIEFTNVNRDVNGNSRYVCHFFAFISKKEHDVLTLDQRYELALKRSRQFGGKKYNNKQYGGGIVFQTCNPNGLGKKIQEFMSTLEPKSFFFTSTSSQPGGQGYYEVVALNSQAAREMLYNYIGSNRWSFEYPSVEDIHPADRRLIIKLEV